MVSVRPSVVAWAHSSKLAAAGLLLWARRAGNIDRLLRDRRLAAAACGGQMRAVPRCQPTQEAEHRLVVVITTITDDCRGVCAWSVVSRNKEDCRQSGSVVVPVHSASDPQYLASVVTEETDCGSLDTPWSLRAPPGQTIHVHLMNFQTAALHPTPADTQHQVPRVCQVLQRVL